MNSVSKVAKHILMERRLIRRSTRGSPHTNTLEAITGMVGAGLAAKRSKRFFEEATGMT